MMEWRLWGAAVLSGMLLAGCAQSPNSMQPRDLSPGHLSTAPAAVAAPVPAIPKPVLRAPILPPPTAPRASETYTVVVNDVPVKELLFALARDAAVNVDVHPDVNGSVTMNAIDQTLDQILDRISNQVPVRFEQKGETLVVGPDSAYLKTYRVDYVNLSRTTKSNVSVATQVSTVGSFDATDSGGGGGGTDENQSTTDVTTTSENLFWETLVDTVKTIVGNTSGDADGDSQVSTSGGTTDVTANREAGILVVRATGRHHREVQGYLDEVMSSAKRQVLIEATIVEVTLNDRYRAGVDFQRLLGNSTIQQSLIGANLGAAPFLLLELANAPVGNPKRDIAVTARLLKEFGNVRVLSTPTIMALNNQTAIFKVVENRVFFTVESDTTQNQTTTLTTVETTPHTVPIGLVMSVTPQIDQNDEVTLNVRPTITRTIGAGVRDPNPALQIESRIPEIAVRELESVLRLRSGQVAVLGGLMQDQTDNGTSGIPGLSEISGVGELFKFRDDNYVKSELVVFLRPTVVRTPSVNSDLRSYRRMLPENVRPTDSPLPSWQPTARNQP